MTRTSSKVSDRFWAHLLVGLAFVAACFFHFRQLDGVIYLNEDEARAFTLLSSGPLIYALGAPVYAFFGRLQSSVFYLAACLGVLSLFLFYRTSRMLFGRSVASLAALIYAIFPLRINYSRTLFPPVFMEVFFMSALFCLVRGLLKSKKRWIFASGVCAAFLFFAHTSSYNLIFGLGVFIAAWIFMGCGEKPTLGQLIRLGALFAGGFLAGFLCLESVFFIAGKGYDYLGQCLQFGDYTKNYEHYSNTRSRFLGELVMRFRLSLASSIGMSVSLLASVLFLIRPMVSSGLKRERAYSALYLSALGLFFALVFAGVHTIYERHFVWISSFVAVSVSYLFLKGLRGKNFVTRCMVGLACLIFLMALCYESYAVTQETFSINSMRSFFAERGISKKLVLSMWRQANLLSDEGVTSEIPGGFIPAGKIADKNFWYLDSPRFLIRWPYVFEAYKQGLARYLVTSGTGTRAVVGEDSPLLNPSAAMVAWPHPYSTMKRRPYYDPLLASVSIRVFDLKKVFSRFENPATQ